MNIREGFEPDPRFSRKTNRHFLPTAQVSRVVRVIAAKLGECVEKIEGRQPKESEVDQHGTKLVQPNGNWTFCWKGRKILRVDFWPDRVDVYPCDVNGSPMLPEGH